MLRKKDSRKRSSGGGLRSALALLLFLASPFLSHVPAFAAGTVKSIGFTACPDNQVANRSWSSAVKVAALVNGQVNKKDNRTKVTLSLASGTGTLSGVLTRTVVAGVATFTNLSYDKGEKISLKAVSSDTAMGSATSPAINVFAPVLSFRTQPGPTQRVGRAWAPFSVQVEVGGVPDVSDNATQITVSASPDGRGPLLGTLTRRAVNGVATFDDISDNVVGLPYTVQASAAGVLPANSNEVSVFAPVLQFGVRPATPQSVGQKWYPPFTAQVTLNGSVDTADNGTDVYATVYTETQPSYGYSAPPKKTVNGVATFDDAYCNTAGWARVYVSVPGSSMPAIQAGNISVVYWYASFQTFPGSALAGKIWPAFTVKITKNGMTDTADNTTVVAVSVNGGTGALSGTTSKQVTQGVATFDNLSYSAAGNWSLSIGATNNPRITPTYTGVTILPLDHLEFGTQPQTYVRQGDVWPAFTVRKMHDTAVDTADNQTRVTLSVPDRTGALSGTLTKTVVAGVATFDDVSSNLAGQISLLATPSDNAIGALRFDSLGVTARLALLSSDPVANRTAVPVGTRISGRFSEAVDRSSVDTNSFYVLDPSNARVPGTYGFSDNDSTCIFTPSAPLSKMTRYTAVFGPGLKDLAGYNLPAYTNWSFTTAGWSTPEALSTGTGSRYPDLAVDDSGFGMVVWQQDNVNGQSLVNARPSPKGQYWWGPLQTLAGGAAPKSYPQVAVNGSAGATAIWVEGGNVRASRYGRNGNAYWDIGTAAILSGPGPVAPSTPPGIAAVDNQVTVVWVQQDNGVNAVWSNYFIDDPLSGTTAPVGSLGGSDDFPRVAMDAAGNAASVWAHFDNTGLPRPVVNRFVQPFVPGNAWGVPRIVPGASFMSSTTRSSAVTASGDGDAIVAWADNGVLHASRHTSDGGWGIPANVSPFPGYFTQSVSLGGDLAGNTVAVWVQSNGIRNDVWAGFYLVGGGWSGAGIISDGAYSCDVPDLATDPRSPSGNAVVAWRRSNGSPALGTSIWATRYLPATGWETPAMLATGTGTFDPPQAAIDGNGNAIVAWSQDGVVYASRYVTTP